MKMRNFFVVWFWLLSVCFSDNANVGKCPGSPNQCSLHGSCMIDKFGQYTCNCQYGWTQKDCSEKLCPHGFDPIESPQSAKNNRKIQMQLSAREGKMSGKMIIHFQGHTVEFIADAEILTSEVCTKMWSKFRNIGQVTCERQKVDLQHGGVYDITFYSFPMYPIMNNIHYHNGNPALSMFICDSSKVVGASQVECSFSDVVADNVKEYAPCSNRGKCDSYTGVCQCNSGFHGKNCGSNKDDQDVLLGISDGPFYTGNLVHLKVERHPSTEFNFIKAVSNNMPILTLDGTGNTTLHKGSLKLKSGKISLENGGVDIVSGDIYTKNSNLFLNSGSVLIHSPHDSHAALHVKVMSSKFRGKSIFRLTGPDISLQEHEFDYLKVTSSKETIFRIEKSGKTSINKGGLSVIGGVNITNGGIEIQSGGQIIKHGGLAINAGDVEVTAGSIRIDQGSLIVQNSGAAISSSNLSKPVLRVESSHNHFQNSTLLSLKATFASPNNSTYFIKAENSVQSIFEVRSTGETVIYSGGVHVKEGGVTIRAGGQRIERGGLQVEAGGIRIESGGLSIANEGFTIEDGGFAVNNKKSNLPTLTVTSRSSSFANNAVTIDATSIHPEKMNFIEMSIRNETKTSIKGDGTIVTIGDIMTTNKGSIVSSGDLIAQSRAILTHIMLEAGNHIDIPCTHSYVKIISDGKKRKNVAAIKSTNAKPGQVLFLQNDDEEDLLSIRVRSLSTSIFLFDGSNWQPLTATEFDSSKLSGVKEIKAANDLDFGEVKISSKDVEVGSQPSGGIAVYGKRGILSSYESFHLSEDQSNHLHVNGIVTKEMTGRVDMNKAELIDATLIGGELTKIKKLSVVEEIQCKGELNVDSQTNIGGGLTVDGPVMGSGAYVDTSDLRFKTDISTMSNVVAKLKGIRGVRYKYRKDSKFDSFNFSGKTEIGFIAQDVEAGFPELIRHDKNGYKYVAYGRMTPILLEGLKETHGKLQQAQNQLRQLQAKYDQLQSQQQVLVIL